jgi:hypothetical protein
MAPEPVDASSTDSVDAPESDLSPNSRPRGLGEDCYIAFLGTAEQTDDCAPSLICLNDGFRPALESCAMGLIPIYCLCEG